MPNFWRKRKRIIIIAGPNGAGKTTFAQEYLPHEGDCPDFINADQIAQDLSPTNPDNAALEAGRMMLEEIDRKVRKGDSFAFETTLAGRSYMRHIRRWRELKYEVTLIFLSLPSADLAVARVQARVLQGGHNIPEFVIRRRFEAGKKNLDLYRPLVNVWEIYENGGPEPKLLEWGENKWR